MRGCGCAGSIGGYKFNFSSRARAVMKSVGKAHSALSAASLQYFSAVCGLHSLSETVFLFSLALFRLIGSKHYGCTSLQDFGSDNFACIHNKTTYIIWTRCPFVNSFLKNNAESAFCTEKKTRFCIFFRGMGKTCSKQRKGSLSWN